MPLPALDQRGLLPDGVHDAEMQEIGSRFCVNPNRQFLWDKFQRFLVEFGSRVGPAELIIAGSFFSDKDIPDDIEATVLTGTDNALIGKAMLLYGERDRIKSEYSVDYYPTLPGQYDFVDFFRYIGPKTAQRKGLGVKDRRGVVRVRKWANG